jgi:lysine-N-methylase
MSILHPTRTLPALLPRYVTRFSCVGPACEDNCCTGWRVTIDKKTFNAYKQINDPKLTPRFTQDVKRQRSQASDSNYARIELMPDSRECPLMEERLCAVQGTLGESYLSNTCFSYPRSSRNFGGQHEQALTLSCPEAARQALLAPDAFDFVESTITVRPDAVSKTTPVRGMPLDLMNEVRIFCLQLMRTGGLEVWQRLAVLGVFCESLTQTLSRAGYAAVPPLLESFVAMVESGAVIEALAGMQSNHPVQAQVFATIWQSKAMKAMSPVQSEVVSAVSQGLGADPDTGAVNSEQLIDCYSAGVQRLPEALATAPHLLENYLLNEMFRELFPFEGTTPYEQYLRLVSRFGLLRLMLAAQCSPEGDLPDVETLVRTTQVFCRLIQHDTSFALKVNSALHNSGWSKLDKVYGFLKS